MNPRGRPKGENCVSPPWNPLWLMYPWQATGNKFEIVLRKTPVLRQSIIGLIAFLFSSLAIASQTGISFTYLLIPKDPSHLKGYRAGVWYLPPCFVWKQIDLYFEASFGHWWVPSSPNQNINITAVAPYLRYYLQRNHFISPYVEASIGPAYLSHTRIGDRNLGIHFTFQDQVTIGATFGKDQQFSASLDVMHYSNGSLSAHNSGITIPLLLNIAYRF